MFLIIFIIYEGIPLEEEEEEEEDSTLTGKLRSLIYKIKGPPKAEKVEPREEEEKSPSKFSFYVHTSVMQVLDWCPGSSVMLVSELLCGV